MGGPTTPASPARLRAMAALMIRAAGEDEDWRAELDRASWGLAWEEKLVLRAMVGED